MPVRIFKRLFPVLFLLILLPAVSYAQVYINEIFYSPTSKQWVEIYNDSDNAIDLTQYKILDAGALVNGHGISLCSSLLSSRSYAIIAKVLEDFSSPTFTLCKSALGIKSTADDTVILKTGLNVIDTITVTEGIAIGGNSLQKSGTSWIAALPTPGLVNATESLSSSTSTATSTTATTTEETTTTTTSYSQSSSNTVTVSTHYIATTLTAIKSDTKFAVGAGRDRLGTVGTPIEFRAEANKETTRQTIFKWNFGDGTVGDGEVIVHSYFYSGEYVVVLNASGPDGQAVSRTNVRIVSPELLISFASPERIEITNNSKSEINLYGRAIMAGSKIFILPQDTIIKSSQKISFGANITGLNPINQSHVSLVIVGTEARPQEMIAKIAEQRLEQIAQIHSQLSILQQQFANVSSQQNSANATVVTVTPPIEEPITEEFVGTEDGDSQTALVIGAVTADASPGIIDNWLQTIKRFFLRTR